MFEKVYIEAPIDLSHFWQDAQQGEARQEECVPRWIFGHRNQMESKHY